ncbi:hypothetical protein B0H14DRAFT_1311441 [Mycena olivaceomarginata]|nr:hypothetical protein B0H14DRAFT_1311441 [Mycena olivaceomarginata]
MFVIGRSANTPRTALLFQEPTMRFAVTAVPTLAAAVCAHSSQGSVALDNLHLRLAEQRHLRRPVLRLRRGQRRRGQRHRRPHPLSSAASQPLTPPSHQRDLRVHQRRLPVQVDPAPPSRVQGRGARRCHRAAAAVCASLPLRHRSPNRHRPFAPFNPAADISGALSSADSSGSGYKSPSATLPARCRSLRPTPGRDSCSRWGLRCWVERTNEYVFLIEMT